VSSDDGISSRGETVNVGALNRELLLGELFGDERGAFTGAVARKPGLLVVADGGTVFLVRTGARDIVPGGLLEARYSDGSASHPAGPCCSTDFGAHRDEAPKITGDSGGLVD